ncbi:MAG TPA: Fic family protein, partial [Ignavibacteria bacterium]|nr:Fic family protein [Ignavibacteria bacterium]
FERNKSLYYDNLNFTRTSNKLDQWIKFFLVAVLETSENGINTFRKILKLREKIESEKLIKLGRRIPNAKSLMKILFSNPIITTKSVSSAINFTIRPSNELIKCFVKIGILKEITGFKRNRVFIFEDYLKLFR